MGQRRRARGRLVWGGHWEILGWWGAWPQDVVEEVVTVYIDQNLMLNFSDGFLKQLPTFLLTPLSSLNRFIAVKHTKLKTITDIQRFPISFSNQHLNHVIIIFQTNINHLKPSIQLLEKPPLPNLLTGIEIQIYFYLKYGPIQSGQICDGILGKLYLIEFMDFL